MGKSRDLAGLEFQSQSVSVAAQNGVATDLFTLPSNNFATYIISVGLLANDTGNYHDVALICTQGTSVTITMLNNSALTAITNSGLTIRGSQSSGIANTLQARLTCLNRE